MPPPNFPPSLPPSSAHLPFFSEQFPIRVPHADSPVNLGMPPTSAPTAAVGVGPSSESTLSFDVEDMTTADLLHNINPDLLDFIKCNTPHVYSGLVAQERTNGTTNTDPSAPIFPSIDPILPTASLPLNVDYSQTQAPSNSNSLRLGNPVRSVTPVSSVSVTSVGINPTTSPSVPIVTPRTPIRALPSPLTMPLPPHLTNPAEIMQNPALMAVLRQAQAMVSIPHFQQAAAPIPSFPPGTAAFNSPRQGPNNATIAAVAGAAAAAAAAAAANSPNPQGVHSRFGPTPLQNRRLPQRARPRSQAQGAPAQTGVPSTQAASASKSSQFPQQMPAPTFSPVQRQLPHQVPATVRGQKRPNSSLRQAASSTATIVNSSLSGKRPSPTSSTMSDSLASASAPASRGRLHPAGGALAGADANMSSRPSSAASSGIMDVPLNMGTTDMVATQSKAAAGQASDIDENTGVEVKKAMRAERNRQSAAASRERKKHYIKELERRVDMLSRENAKMQVTQFRLVRERLVQESKILDQVKELKRKVVNRDMEIHKLSRELQNARLKSGDSTDDDDGLDLPRPSTWDAAEWKNRGSRRRV